MTSAVRASFWRGGTSNGLLINEQDLPPSVREAWLNRFTQASDTTTRTVLEPFFAALMGSPDPYGRQLNGMGGGISSLSKIVVVSRPERRAWLRAHVDYTFLQMGIKDGRLDMAGNCGNMSAAVVPFAINERIIHVEEGASSPGTALVHMRNINTNKIIHVTTPVLQSSSNRCIYNPSGSTAIDGVSGTSSRLTLSFRDPAGSKTGKALPTGNPIDSLSLPNGETIQASLIDVSNPGVFISGRDVDWDPTNSPADLDAARPIMEKLELIRRRGAEMMGLHPHVGSIPKIVLLFPAETREGVDIACQALSMEQAHKAVPVTLALNLGVACKLPGTIPYQLSKHLSPDSTVVGHPSGKLEVGATIEYGRIVAANLVRTARCHMEGYVNYEPSNVVI